MLFYTALRAACASMAMGLTILMVLIFSTINAYAQKALSHEAEFRVSFAGLPIGVANFDLKVKGETYQLSVSGKTTGLSRLLSNGKGSVKSTGLLRRGRIQSNLQRLNYKDKKKKVSSLLVFKNNNLISEKLFPKPKNHPDKIPVYDTDKLGVIDPASGVIIPVTKENIGKGRKICNRRIAIYDGGARYDVALRYKREEKLSTKGFKGKVFVCQLRWIPIAGHRPKKNVKYMAGNKDMEISYAQLANSAVYMPIRIKVPTKYGTVLAKAIKFVSQ